MSIVERLVPPRGLRVLVSAGASGIGAVIAEAFAEAGAKIHVCDVSAHALSRFRDRFPESLATRADVADPAQVAAVFGAQRERFGGLDVLVNNAGIAGPIAGINIVAEEEWRHTVDVSLNAQYRLAHHAVPTQRESPSANMISMSWFVGRLGYAWHTRHEARRDEMGDHRAGEVPRLRTRPERHPRQRPAAGHRRRPAHGAVIRSRAEQLGIEEPEMRGQYINRISLKPMVTVEDVALMALFLRSSAARNITAQAISEDGNVEYF